MKDTRLGVYRVISPLGSGGMGTVYLAEVEERAPGLERGDRVALKVVHPHLLETEGFFKRFLREAEIGQRVVHDNVVRCHDCDALPVGGQPRYFLVMEYVEGQTLRALLDELGKVPEALCRHVGREIAKGLVAIHAEGVIHRDLKPENVLITPGNQIKIMDLGVARLQDEAVRLSKTGHFAGSVLYAAPEAFRDGDGKLDARADLHSLGILLYELATGVHPFRHDDMRTVLKKVMDETPRRAGEVNPQLGSFFEEVVHTLAAKDPEARFADATTLLDVLEQGERGAWWEERARKLRHETRRPLRRIRIPRETGLYGRDDELLRLGEAYDRVRSGDGRVALVEGEAGIGKTRLVDEFVGRLLDAGEDPNFLFGSYPPGGAATVSGAFSTAYREHFGDAGLEDALSDYLPHTPVLVPAFAALLRGEPPPSGQEALTKDSLQTVFVRATQALAAERPTIVLIDDLHFAPAEGRALFASLALAAPEHRILLVGTMRPGVPPAWTADVERQEHTMRLLLGRLGPKDLARLLQDALQSERLAEELGWQIARKSDGNPFFAFEIIRGLKEGQLITQSPDGSWVTTQDVRDVQVPSSILDLVGARVADLSEVQRDLLDVAACCGFEFDASVLARAMDTDTLPTLKHLGQIERKHRLVRAAGRRFAFDHHQVQEVLYGRLAEPLREAYHGSIGDAIAIQSGVRDRPPAAVDGEVSVELCEHYLKSDRAEAAQPYLEAALTHFERGYLNDRAIRLVDRALEVEGLLEGDVRCRMMLRKAARLDLLGRRDAERETAEQALSLARELDLPAREAEAKSRLGWQRVRLGEASAATTLLEEAIEAATQAGDRRVASEAQGQLGLAILEQGRAEEAREHLDVRLAYLEETGDLGEAAGALGNIGIVYWRQGRREEALAAVERSLALARETGHRRHEGSALGNLCILYRQMGREDDAKRCAERQLPLVREIGDRQGEANGTMALGAVLQGTGPREEALRHYEHALAIYREVGDRKGEAYALGNLGSITWCAGHLDASRIYYESCCEASRDIDDAWGLSAATGDLGYLWLLLGDRPRARGHFEAALKTSRDLRYVEGEGDWLVGLGEVAAADGDFDEAVGRLEEALALYRGAEHSPGIGDTLRVLGRVSHARGDRAAALEYLAEAERIGRETDAPDLFLRARARRAALDDADWMAVLTELEQENERLALPSRLETRYLLWRASRDAAQLEAAKRLLDHLAEHAPDGHEESLIRDVGLHEAVAKAWSEHVDTGS